MRKFGLVGRNISYSFSRDFFRKKFERENIDATYENFDMEKISRLPLILKNNPGLQGFNVTIPFKQAIMPFLDALDPEASEIAAVNTVKISKTGKLTGYNTDHFGFSKALVPHLQKRHKKALILGTGGASKAVIYALQSLGIVATSVSRKSFENAISYEELSSEIMAEHLIIINCTPLGTYPNISEFPPVPVEKISSQHLIFDLIYNPEITRLMELAHQKGATVVNGQKMLEYQAERAWEIWDDRHY